VSAAIRPAAGADLEAVAGIQGHYVDASPDPWPVSATLDRLARQHATEVG
jgi:hypothetical protein